MFVDIVCYRARIGLFNLVKMKSLNKGASVFGEITEILLQIYASFSWVLVCFLITCMLPILLVTFLVLNFIPAARVQFPILNDFSIFLNVWCSYISISMKFTANITVYIGLKFSQKCQSCINFKLFCMSFCLATVLASLILLAGDIFTNPGPLTFCHWNLGGLQTDNFAKKYLLEAFLAVNDFDIVVLGETHLTSKIDEDDLEIDGYTNKRCDHPDDMSRGGIAVYYKSALSVLFKPELTKLTESLVFQVKVGNKKCFFTCVYRNPSKENNSIEKIDEFSTELGNTLNKIKGKNPYINLVIGDLNAKNSAWYGEITDYPGLLLADTTSLHGLTQIIDQPTNFEPNKTPSCIDLIFSSQPNLLIDYGTLASLLTQCHHSIIYAKIDLAPKLPKPTKRKMWDYSNADECNIRKVLSSVNWERNILYKNPNNQVEFLTESIVNTFSNFCPNRVVTCRFKDKPWMTNEIKQKLKEKAKVYKK